MKGSTCGNSSRSGPGFGQLVIGAGAIIWKEYSDMKEGMDARYKQMETDALRRDVGSGKVKIDDLRKRGMTDDERR